jgi:hypothetical protein
MQVNKVDGSVTQMILNCRRPVRIVAVAMLKVKALTNETKEKMGFAVPKQLQIHFFKKKSLLDGES